MTLLTVVEAAKQFSVSRPRIYRAIKNGDLTPVLEDGTQKVQSQDMIRLFGGAKKTVRNAVQEHVRVDDTELVKILREQLKQAEQDKDFLKKQIVDLRKDYDDFKLMIEYKSETDNRTDVTVTNNGRTGESLQNEQLPEQQKMVEIVSHWKDDRPKQRKGLLRRFFG